MSDYLTVGQVVDSVSITHKFDKTHLNFLNTSDVERGKIINVNHLPVNKLKGQAKKTIKKNDILFSEIRPKNRRYAYVNLEDTKDFVVSTKLMVLRNKNPNVDQRYFYYFLTNDGMLSILQNRAENRICSFPQITFDLLADYKIRVPTLIEQKKIVSVLSAIDAKIELNNCINAELEAMTRTLYDYWFVQFDFPDQSDNPYKSSGGIMVYNDTLKREIPEGWSDGTLDDVGQIVGGSTPTTKKPCNFTDKGTPWITPNDLSNNQGNKFIARGVQDVTAEGIKNASLKKHPVGTVLLSSRAPIGYMAIAREELTTNQGFKSFIPNKGYSSVFIYHTILHSMKAITQYASGSTFKEISGTVLKTVKICLPTSTPVERYTRKTESIFNRQDLLEQENQQLSQLRDWLLPMLMNGQVKVA
jgi:type I restriction enzyme S subunit